MKTFIVFWGDERSEFMKNESKQIKLFEDTYVRSEWDDEKEEWLLSVIDVVQVLTDSADPKQYVKKMRSRDSELNSRWGTICTPTAMTAKDGKKYKTTAANVEGILRIVQSIPSPEAEPFKQWLAEVGSARLDEMVDPELSIEKIVDDYRRLGYGENWINQRLKSIEVRKGLTDEWQSSGVEKGKEYATRTDIITKGWSGKNTREYKKHKG